MIDFGLSISKNKNKIQGENKTKNLKITGVLSLFFAISLVRYKVSVRIKIRYYRNPSLDIYPIAKACCLVERTTIK